jgi:glucokinase
MKYLPVGFCHWKIRNGKTAEKPVRFRGFERQLLTHRVIGLAEDCSEMTAGKSMRQILTADIGGTNSRFSHFEWDPEGGLRQVKSIWLKTKAYESFSELMKDFGERAFTLKPEKALIAVFAVAGPVEGGTYADPPLISWDVDVSEADVDFGLRNCLLINDFVAQAFACRSPVGEAATRVVPGTLDQDGTVAVVGAGTGFGLAALVPDGYGGHVAMPSEGGHATFPFEGEEEHGYAGFLRIETGEIYATPNTVVSGRGLSLVHQYLTGDALSPEAVSAHIEKASKTLQWFSRFYARMARNFALQTVATGGLYIAGGVAAKVPKIVTHGAFMEEFRRSESSANLLERIPVFLNANEESGLWGAAVRGVQELKRMGRRDGPTD